MIDKKIFAENYEIFDKEIVKEIIEIYLQEYPDRIANLRTNIHQNDLDSLYKNAHSFKGVTANFFDNDTVELARQLETKGKEQDDTGLDELLGLLIESSKNLIDELKALAKEYS
jgi:HPt (histidine-containing phosphotransfer) domain-containing protein